MTLASLEEVAIRDEEGSIVGLQFDGRERSIQEWKERKEADEFAALVERLQKRNSAQRARADPVRQARIRENERRHRESGRKQQRMNALRREKYEADPVVNVCEECGEVDTVLFEKKSVKRSRFCSRSCRNRHHGRTRKRARGLRKMNVRDQAFCFLRSVESATAAEVAAAIGAKVGSMRTCLCRWAKASELDSDNGRPARYSTR
jgi:hypothetical protein